MSVPIRNLVHYDCSKVVFLEIGSSRSMRWRHSPWRLPIYGKVVITSSSLIGYLQVECRYLIHKELPISWNTTSPQQKWTRFLIGTEIYLVSTTLILICVTKTVLRFWRTKIRCTIVVRQSKRLVWSLQWTHNDKKRSFRGSLCILVSFPYDF